MNDEKKVKVYLGVCKDRYIIGKWYPVMDAMRNTMKKAGVWGGGFEQQGARIDWNANEIVHKFLETDCTHLLMLETDIYALPQSPIKLLTRDKDIVGGLYFHRGEHWPIAMVESGKYINEWNHEVAMYKPMRKEVYGWIIENKIPMVDDAWVIDGEGGLLEVDIVGMGLTLIKREVFNKMPGPWYEDWESATQDVSFCMKARKLGFKVFCDMSVIMGHYVEQPCGQAEFRQLYEKGAEKADEL